MKDFNVFDMGVKGVNLVSSPLALEAGELTQAQNAEPFSEQGVAGIRKRLGLQRVVPTGSVAPGALDGPPGLVEVIEENFLEDDVFYGGLRSTDGGLNWTPFTLPTTLLPNKYYDLRSGGGATYDVTLTPLLPAVWLDGIYYFGGHESGQILAFDKANDDSRGAGFYPDVRIRESARIVGTGSVDDCFPLPGLFMSMTGTALVIALIGGGVQLYYPSTGVIQKLPTLGATATGSATFANRLWVVSGLSLYSIDPNSETSWTLAATVADAGIAALTGLALHGGALYAGSRTNAVQPVRCYKFVIATDTWLATATTSASVVQSAAPSYMLGPFPQMSGARVQLLYFGTAPAFTTLIGSLGNAETMVGVGWRILTLDIGTAGPWHNGVDTNSNDLINNWWAGSTNREVGPIQMWRGVTQIHIAHVDASGDRINFGRLDGYLSNSWSNGGAASDQNVTSFGQTIYRWPVMF